MADVVADSLRKATPAMVRHRRKWQQAFEKQLAAHWGGAFEAAEAVMKAAFEIGEFHYEKHVPPDGQRSYAFEALARLQARALRITEEVLALLKSGYGQAAMSRWRSLDILLLVARSCDWVTQPTATEREPSALARWRARVRLAPLGGGAAAGGNRT